MSTTEKLLETVYSDSLRVDRENAIIRNVKILGRHSRNRRVYTDQAMEQAAALYEGVDVNIDHPAPQKATAERKLAEGLGMIAGVQRRDDGVYGDLHYLKTHPLAEMVLERAERMPRHFGLSHNAEGRITHRDGQMIVEGVERVLSVDLVRHPATNAGLFESQPHHQVDKNAKEPVMKATEPQLQAEFKEALQTTLNDESLDFPSLLDRVGEIVRAHEEPETSQPASQPEGVSESLRELTERLEQIERRETVRSLLEEKQITPGELDRGRLALLLEQPDREAMQQLIESWPPSVTTPKPSISSARREESWLEQPKDAKEFALAVR